MRNYSHTIAITKSGHTYKNNTNKTQNDNIVEARQA